MNVALQRLEDRKAMVREAAKSMLDAADESGRDLTAAEQKLFDAHSKELDELNTKIVEEQSRLAANHGKPSPAWEDQGGPSFFDDPPTIAKQGKIGAKYRDLFGASVSSDGWRSPQEYFAAIHSGMANPRLNCLVEGTGSGGGFLVPTEYAAEMLDAAMENSVVLPRSRVYPMTTEVKKIAGFDASTNEAATLFGGIESQWLGETEEASVTNPLVRKIELRAKKLALFTSTSNEIAEDGTGLEGQLTEAMRSANGWFLDYAFLRGNGVGQPLGVLHDPSLITVDPEAMQDADSLVYENVCKMLARLHVGCFANSVWVANPTLIPQMLSMVAPVGLGGVPIQVLSESNGKFTMLTRPVIFSEKLPVLGDAGDLLLADFSQYAIGLRREVTMEKSHHIRFMSDETVWRAITRVDGCGRWNQPFTPANGDSQSWCVTLGARA